MKKRLRGPWRPSILRHKYSQSTSKYYPTHDHTHEIYEKSPAQRTKGTRNVATIGLILNILLAGAKLAGGIIGYSHALIADAIHSFTDCFTDIAILVGVHYWSRPPDTGHPHGHARIETIVSGAIGALLIITALWIAYTSFGTINDTSVRQQPTWIAFAIALFSIFSKEFLCSWTLVRSKKLKSPALAASAWHHRSDALSSIPVVIVVLAARLNTELIFLDGLGGVIVSFFIIRAGLAILHPVLWELSDSAAPKEIRDELEQIALKVAGVKDVHEMRTRFQGEGIQVDMHIVVSRNLSIIEAYNIAKEVENRIYSHSSGVIDVLIRTEPELPQNNNH